MTISKFIFQSERADYKHFVNTKFDGDYTAGAKHWIQLKNRPADDVFGERKYLVQFTNTKHNFDTFVYQDWNDYWILSQHCDFDRKYQKSALSVIKKYQGKNSSNYKYLLDRISCGLTGTQKYGTQDVCDKDNQQINI